MITYINDLNRLKFINQRIRMLIKLITESQDNMKYTDSSIVSQTRDTIVVNKYISIGQILLLDRIWGKYKIVQ